jgi:hypothetical protein
MNSNNVMVTNYRLLSSFSQEEKNDDMSRRRRRNTAIKGMIKPINFKEISVILEQDSRT